MSIDPGQLLVVPPKTLRLKDTALVILKLAGLSEYGELHFDELFDIAEISEITKARGAGRRGDKIAGKIAAKIAARAVVKEWLGLNVPLSWFRVLSPNAPVRITVPTDAELDRAVSSIKFSISHSGDMVAAAASLRHVGIDVERLSLLPPETVESIGNTENYGDLAQYQAALSVMDSADVTVSELAAVSTFTRKEAILKAVGIGLADGIDDLGLDKMRLGKQQHAEYRHLTFDVVTEIEGEYTFSLAIVDEPPVSMGETFQALRSVSPSSGQQAIYRLEKTAMAGSAFSLAWQEILTGEADVNALRQALQYMVNRHEALRWRFEEHGGQVEAKVCRVQPAILEVLDLCDSEAALEKSERQIQCVVEQGFDLEEGPLFRVLLFRLSPEQQTLGFFFHHIIIDASSALVFRQDFAAAYNGFRAGEGVIHRSLPKPYSDCVNQQGDELNEERKAELVSYWRDTLDGCSTSIALSAAAYGDVDDPYVSDAISFEISSEVCQRLQDRAGEEGVTQFVIMLAAYQLLLAKLSGENDFSVGVPFAGRESSETFSVIGYFVNLLPVRSAITASSTIRDLILNLRAMVMGAMEHQDLPLAELIASLDLATDNVHAPLFQNVIRLVHEQEVEVSFQGLAQQHQDIVPQHSLYDLNLFISMGAERGRGRLEYRSKLFTRLQAQKFTDQFIEYLQLISDTPDKKLEDVVEGLASKNNTDADYWNEVPVEIPSDRVEALFLRQLDRAPDATAVATASEIYSYSQLNNRANQLVGLLMASGVQQGEYVGVTMERSLDVVASMLAVLKSGCAYVPMDPNYPVERLKFIAQDTGMRFVLTHQVHLEKLNGTAGTILAVDSSIVDGIGSVEPPLIDSSPDDVAYVMYTSGSTGRPKGIVIRHTGIVRLLFGIDYVALDENQVLLQLASLSFDASTFEIWGALLHGGKCVLYPEALPYVAVMKEVIQQHGVTTMFLTTALLNSIVDVAPEILSPVRQLLFGGEKVSPEHVRRAREYLPHTKLVHCYGPTETTTFSTSYEVPARSSGIGEIVPIGRAISNTTLRILDEERGPVVFGEVGEIYIGGAGLAVGYLNQPEMTAEKFVRDPYSSKQDEKLYRSGDLARRLAGGEIEFIGRIDHQVKIRGFRIEPGEIESELRMHPAVKEVAVVPRQQNSQTRLVAFLTLKERGGVQVKDIRSYLRSRLVPHMNPDLIVVIDAMPYNENFKIDRGQLQGMPVDTTMQEQGFTEPRDHTDALLLDIWNELLGCMVGIDDDFFEVGGNSLLAVSLLAKIEKYTGKNLSFSILFSRATIRGLAAALVEEDGDASDNQLVVLREGEGDTPLFFLHGDFTGGGFFSKEIADSAHLSGDFIAVQPHGLIRGKEIPLTLKDMAAEHLATIKQKQDKGPYRLAGYCISGLIAFEIAQQLLAQGEEVEFLGMIDPPSAIDDKSSLVFSEPFENLKKRYSKNKNTLELLKQDEEHRREMLNHYSAISVEYQPEAYPHRISLFMVSGGNKKARVQGWRKIANGIDAYKFDEKSTGHFLPIKVNAPALGRSLSGAMKCTTDSQLNSES